MAYIMKITGALLVALGAATVALSAPTAAAPASRAACPAIAAELRAQGAPPAVVSRFVAIAWRESGCVPQRVVNRTDRSWSRFGLNYRGAMPRYWSRVCGVADWTAPRVLSVDVRCALAAYHANGWRPWA